LSDFLSEKVLPEGSYKIPYQPRAVQAKAQPERVSAAKDFFFASFDHL
jgi:hypothetical protein